MQRYKAGPSGIALLTIRILRHGIWLILNPNIFGVDILGVDCFQNITSVLLMVLKINYWWVEFLQAFLLYKCSILCILLVSY